MEKNKNKRIINSALALGLCTAMMVNPICVSKAYADDDKSSSISIDMSQYEYNEGNEYYSITDKIDTLTGTVSGDLDKIKSLSYSVEDDKGIVIKSGELSVMDNWTISEIGFVLGKNTVTLTAEAEDEVIEEKINIYNEDISNIETLDIDQNDSDNDGLVNYWEEYFGTDANNPDTDGDGILDLDEITVLGTNPLMMDTDQNGINDGDEDFDQDGITNIEELKLGTNPNSIDTDGDSLSDYDEIYIYGTNPTLEDTDGDGANDGWEVNNNYDPLVRNKKFEVLAVSEGGEATLYSKKLTGEQAQDFSLYISDDYNLQSVVGAKSAAYRLGANVKAEITIPCVRTSEAQDLRIYEYDTNKQKFVSLKTTEENGMLTANTKDSKASLYIVLDKKEYDANRKSNNANNSSAKDSNNDGISDADTKKMCNGELLTSSGNLVFGDASYNDVQKNADFDGDGLKNGEEITIVKGDDGIYYVQLLSSPILFDTDNDGINDYEDTAPLERGLKDGIIGAVQIYSRHNPEEAFFLGHAFLVYTSYVNDSTLTIDKVNRTFRYDENLGTYVQIENDPYELTRGEYASIGNYRSQGLDIVYDSVTGDYEALWSDSGLNEYLDKDNLTLASLAKFLIFGGPKKILANTILGFADSSIRINQEITNAYEGYLQYPNAVLTQEITQEQLDQILEYDNKHNYYLLLGNNCSSIATGAWNLAFNDSLYARTESGLYSIFDTPMVLKANILERDGAEKDLAAFGVSVSK